MSYIKSFKDTLKNFGFSKTDSKKLYDVLLKEEIGEELLYEFISQLFRSLNCTRILLIIIPFKIRQIFYKTWKSKNLFLNKLRIF